MRVFATRFSERAICTVASGRLKPANCFAICNHTNAPDGLFRTAKR